LAPLPNLAVNLEQGKFLAMGGRDQRRTSPERILRDDFVALFDLTGSAGIDCPPPRKGR
jgi:hypothetical protein